jgi:hypothetical protein
MSKKKCPYNDRNGYVYVNRKPVALKAPDGSRCKSGTKEALTAYHRFHVELQTNPTFLVPKNERNITLDEVAAAYLGRATRFSFFRHSIASRNPAKQDTL